MYTVQAAWAKAGGYSTALVKARDEGDHFLQMPPYEAHDFTHPVFLQRQRHEVHTVNAGNTQFWSAVKRTALTGWHEVGLP